MAKAIEGMVLLRVSCIACPGRVPCMSYMEYQNWMLPWVSFPSEQKRKGKITWTNHPSYFRGQQAMGTSSFTARPYMRLSALVVLCRWACWAPFNKLVCHKTWCCGCINCAGGWLKCSAALLSVLHAQFTTAHSNDLPSSMYRPIMTSIFCRQMINDHV